MPRKAKKDKKIGKVEQRKYFLKACKKVSSRVGTSPRIFAIDPARNNCGWAFQDKELKFGTVKPQPGITSFKKVVVVTDEITKMIDEFEPNFIFMEGYAYGEMIGREQAGETQGCIKYRLVKRSLPLLQPTPHQIKKYIGAQRKSHIMMEVLDKWKIKSGNDNEADAIIQIYMAKAVFTLAKYVVKRRIKSRINFEKNWKELYTAEGILQYQAEVVYKLLWRQGQMIDI